MDNPIEIERQRASRRVLDTALWLLFGLTNFVAVVYAGWIVVRTGKAAMRIVNAADPSTAVWQPFRFRNTADGPLRDGFGITYIGWGGVTLAGVQILVTVLGLLACFSGRKRVRAIGAFAFTAMGALWFSNLLYMAAIADPQLFLAPALIHGALFACVCVFVLRRLRAS